jgi:HD superfamily phosphodiesterase
VKYTIDTKYADLWQEAFKYQDFRNDRGHAFIVTLYAQDICTYEKANPAVVIPAAILHDIGWSKVPHEDRMLAFVYGVDKEKMLRVRIQHQDEGVKLAREILTKLVYPADLIDPILEIISQHDTRKGFINADEGAMRDADKLWRFDDHGFLNDNQNGGYDFKTDIQALEKKLADPKFMYFESSYKRAWDMLHHLQSKYLS